MDENQHRFFPDLTPPPGGLEKLQRQLKQQPEPSGMRLRVFALSLATVCICFTIWLAASEVNREGKPDYVAQALASLIANGDPALIRFGLADAPSEAVTVPSGERKYMAVERVAVPDPIVVYYRVAMLSPADTSIPSESDERTDKSVK
jgi:hypothetical protein